MLTFSGGKTTLATFLLIAQLILGIALTVLIVFQTQNSGAGSVFGSDTTVYRTRRGLEKTLYQATIVLSIIFVLLTMVTVRVVG
jgi:preprotein translocase subunit SecG